MAQRIEYRSGGNPSLAAGLFAIDDRGGRGGPKSTIVRLAWWPEGVEPSARNIDMVVTELVWKRNNEKPVTREQILELIRPSIPDLARGAYRRRG